MPASIVIASAKAICPTVRSSHAMLQGGWETPKKVFWQVCPLTPGFGRAASNVLIENVKRPHETR